MQGSIQDTMNSEQVNNFVFFSKTQADTFIREQQKGSAAAGALRQKKKTHAGERLDGGYNYIKLARMAYYVNKDAYLDSLASHIADLEPGSKG